ncbi:MAG: glycosyltransferase [Chitinophagaceae bacterium]|nr:glycosyltransferase [Chitinophagaceae bacterium]
MAGIDGEVIVVDNNSSDGSREFFEGRFPGVKFIFNEENTGFAKANNQALEIAKGKYILFLNPDTLVPEDCFSKCIGFLESKDTAGALGVKMLDGSGRFLKESKRSFPDPKTSLYKLMGLTKLFPKSKEFARYYLGHLNENETNEVDVLAGAFMMIPKKVLDITGGFDEDFFMYGEDIDLSYRIQKAGFKNYYFPETTIIHFKGESTQKGSLDYVKMFYKAMSIFANKHYGGSRSGVFNFFIQTGIFLRGILSGFKRLLRPIIGQVFLDIVLIFLSFVLVRFAVPERISELSPALKEPYWYFFGIFLFSYFLCGFLWDIYIEGYTQRKMNRSIGQAGVLVWTAFIILPDKFSELVLSVLLSMFISYVLISFSRMLLISVGVIEKGRVFSETVNVAGDQSDVDRIKEISDPEIEYQIVPLDGVLKTTSYGKRRLFSRRETKRVVFCCGTYPLKDVIEELSAFKTTLVVTGFFTKGCHSVLSGGNTEQDFSETGD